MKLQYIVFVWSALLVGFLVRADIYWQSSKDCYACSDYDNNNKCTGSDPLPQKTCVAPAGYYPYCTKFISTVHGDNPSREVRRGCYIVHVHNVVSQECKNRYHGANYVETTCHCWGNLCNN